MQTKSQGPSKEYWIRWSPKTYRYKEEGMQNHAPQSPGIYEVVTFPAPGESKVVYVGLTLQRTIFDCLKGHWDGDHAGISAELNTVPPVVYFDFIWQSDAASAEDLQDIAWWLVETNHPSYNAPGSVAHSGRYSDINVVEK